MPMVNVGQLARLAGSYNSAVSLLSASDPAHHLDVRESSKNETRLQAECGSVLYPETRMAR